MDSPIHTECFHPGGANTLTFTVDGGNTFNSFVMDPLEHGRATWRHDMDVQIHADVNVTLQDLVERSVVDSAGFFANDIWLDNWTNSRATDAAPTVMMFPSESMCFLSKLTAVDLT